VISSEIPTVGSLFSGVDHYQLLFYLRLDEVEYFRDVCIERGQWDSRQVKCADCSLLLMIAVNG
jgi:hypothetical protein